MYAYKAFHYYLAQSHELIWSWAIWFNKYVFKNSRLDFEHLNCNWKKSFLIKLLVLLLMPFIKAIVSLFCVYLLQTYIAAPCTCRHGLSTHLYIYIKIDSIKTKTIFSTITYSSVNKWKFRALEHRRKLENITLASTCWRMIVGL